ncbi:MAG: deoxyribose-phosphate aldolase [Bacteroidetes bacterium]|nr:MAG: deoxyribose-phosphate aldolase [Bacteroidota bacterium]PTM08572.1 MAG: deoxyribose-phosphate aldolase [Bacteroidota bacterium]
MNIASYFDHTLLRPGTTAAEIRQLCQEAVAQHFAAVCIPPYYLSEARPILDGSGVKLATVIGFPFGYAATVAKVEEIKRGIDEGAEEFDVVVNIAAVKSGNWSFVRNDIDRVVTSCRLRSKPIKIILETGLLTEEEIRQLCAICNDLDPDYVKTSTGFNGPGATVEVVQFLRSLLKKSIKIKASGGIRTAQDAEALIAAGADRLGLSGAMAIVGG